MVSLGSAGAERAGAGREAPARPAAFGASLLALAPYSTFHARPGGAEYVGVDGPGVVLELGTNGEGAVVAKGPGGTLYPVPDAVAARGHAAVGAHLSNQYRHGGITDVYRRPAPGDGVRDSPAQAARLRDAGWALYREGVATLRGYDAGGLTATDLRILRDRVTAYSEGFARGVPPGAEGVYAAVLRAAPGGEPSLLQQIDRRLATPGSDGDPRRPAPRPFAALVGTRFGRPIAQSFEVGADGRGAYALRLGGAPTPFFVSNRPVTGLDLTRGPAKAALEREGARQGAGEPTPPAVAPPAVAPPTAAPPSDGVRPLIDPAALTRGLRAFLDDPGVRAVGLTAANAVGGGTRFTVGGLTFGAYLLLPTKVLLEKGPEAALAQATLFISVPDAWPGQGPPTPRSPGTGMSLIYSFARQQLTVGTAYNAVVPGTGGSTAVLATFTGAPTPGVTSLEPRTSLVVNYGFLVTPAKVPFLKPVIGGINRAMDLAGTALDEAAIASAAAGVVTSETGVGFLAGEGGAVLLKVLSGAVKALKLVGNGLANGSYGAADGVRIEGLRPGRGELGVVTVHGNPVPTTAIVDALRRALGDPIEGVRRAVEPLLRR